MFARVKKSGLYEYLQIVQNRREGTKELDRRLEKAGHCFEWADIKQDLKALQEITIEDRGKTLAIRSECLGTCGKVFQSVGVAIPSTIREVA